MAHENQAGEGREKEANIDVARGSFHGRLLSRSTISLPDPRKRGPLARLASRANWIAVLAQLVSQGATFAGGLAIGAGAMLLNRGEPLKSLPGLMIAIGFGCVLLAIIASALAREGSHSWTSAAKG